MTASRTTGTSAGILFIIGTVASLASNPFLTSINTPNPLASVSANSSQVLWGAFLALIAGLASAGIAISLYPVLRKHSEGIALAAVGFRLIEGMLYISAVLCLLVLVTLSQETAGGHVAMDSSQVASLVLLAAYRWTYNVGALISFSIGALMYYWIFYRARLIPRWLSGWGLAGALLCAVAGVLVMSRVIGPLSTGQLILALPIAVQEMVLAVWLIARGALFSV